MFKLPPHELKLAVDTLNHSCKWKRGANYLQNDVWCKALHSKISED